MNRVPLEVGLLLLLWAGTSLPSHAASSRVSLIVDSELGPPARHGLQQLQTALEARGAAVERRPSLRQAGNGRIVVLGYSKGSEAVRVLAQAGGVALSSEPEALRIHAVQWNGKEAILICAADDRGLMYAALDVADQIRLGDKSAHPLDAVANASEKPAIRERSITKIIMNRADAEQYLYSEDYWTEYLNMLARNRYNTFVFTFGYGSAGYFDPPYPFFFDLPEFPAVRVIGITAQQQQRNIEMLHRIARMTHERGISFNLAIWTHIFRAKQQKPGLPFGLTDDNLVDYTRAALKKFLAMYPEIDGLQFRVHVESSLSLPQQAAFWREVYKVIADTGRNIPVTMRVKGFTDDLIDTVLDTPVKTRLLTKHWGEEMGLPFHPTEDDLVNKYKRRHSYADLLEYPRRYDMMYTLWSHGTVKILLWGDPEYARRFTQSCLLWGGPGYDLYEPLAFKMGYKMGYHDGPTYDVLPKSHQYYRWEYERYWHYYQVFGRLGYNPDTPPRVWRAEFESRFGKEAAASVERAYALGSQVLPRIVAYATRDMSAGFTWPEKQRWEDLPEYIDVRPADTAQFLGIEEAARFHLQGLSSAKISPEQNSRWFRRISAELMRLVEDAESKVAPNTNKEFASTAIDMKVLAHLAAYHSRRLAAGTHFAFFEKTGDLNALDEAIRHEGDAIRTWEKIVPLTEHVYPDNIIMGRAPRLTGSWKDELAALRKGLQQLERRRDSFQPPLREVVARLDFGDGPAREGFLPVTSKHQYSLSKGGYGWHHAYLLPSPSPDFLRGPEPEEYADSAFGIDLPNGEYELLFSMADRSGRPVDHGPMWIVAQGIHSTDRFRIPAGQVVQKKLRGTVVDGRLNFVVNSSSDGDWILDSLVIERVGPVIGHVPVRKTPGDADVAIRATIAGPDPIRSVRLVYGSDEAGYQQVVMTSAGRLRFEARIARQHLADGIGYFIEAVDEAGRRTMLPREGPDRPFRISVTSDDQPPVIVHDRVRSAGPGQPLLVTARVNDPSGVKSVHLRYRGVNQHQDFHNLRMLPAAPGGEYRAEIPADHIDPRWDLMYYIEAVDRYGNGKIYPDLEHETPYVLVDRR